MRILFIHNRYRNSYGGEDATLQSESSLLSARGHDVKEIIFDNADMGTSAWGKLSAGIRSAYSFSAATKVRKEIAVFKPDVVHVHNFFFMASPSVIIEVSRHKIPVIVTLQNYRLICVNALLLRNNNICELCVHRIFPWPGIKYACYHGSRLESSMVGYMAAIHKIAGTWRNKVDMFITPAEFTRNKLIDSSLNISAKKITVKRNFVEDPGIGPVEDRKPFYLFVGRLSKEKGVDFLLQCFSRLPEEQLVIAGDGPEKEGLMNTFGHLPNIRFLGKKSRPEIISWMKLCRALLFPSIWYEGAPVTIIESLATGTPVIASQLGAMGEMIAHRINGLLYKTGNEEQFKEALVIMTDQSKQKNASLYEGARNSYLNTFHPDVCYAAVMAIYENAIKRKTV